MKLTGIVLGILLLSFAASTQAASNPVLLPDVPVPSMHRAVLSPSFYTAVHNAALSAARPEPIPAPQEIQGVTPLTDWQASFGFTYTRFYELPGTVVNTNGFNVSMAYYFSRWMAAEGEVDAGMGSLLGTTTESVFTGGGVRMRTIAPKPLTLWIHGLAGVNRFTPKTTYGGTVAMGYEVGGGIDFNTRHHGLGYRLGADLLDTSFFGTYQVSPKVSAGIVFKF